jgi:hypothetical protein
MAATTQRLDFTNVKEGGKFNKKRFPEGDYAAKITKVEDAESKRDKSPMWLYTIEVKHKGAVGTYPYYCQMSENVLWKLRQLFAACGIIIPKKRVSLDPNKIVGRSIGVTLQDSEYNDKINSEVQFAIPLSEVVSADEEEDEETDDEEVEEEETAEEEEETEEVEEEEEEEEPEPAPKRRVATKKAAPAPPAKKAGPKKRTVKDEDLEELDLEDL